MLSYADLKHRPKTLMAMTGLKPSEFDELLSHFTATWREEAGPDSSNGGRPPTLAAKADRLPFIVFYLKTYRLQAVIAHLLGLSQPQANDLTLQLAAVLGKALEAGGHSPARLTDEMLARPGEELRQGPGIGGTERRVNRPADALGQRIHHSGKEHATP